MVKKLLCGIMILGAFAWSEEGTNSQALQGWISDAQCARARASNGVYTATNATCAKRCLKQGAKLVLILPKELKVLNIENPKIAEKDVGNLVDTVATLDSVHETVRIHSLKLVQAGVEACERSKSTR